MLYRGLGKRRPLNVGLVTNDRCITFMGRVSSSDNPHPSKSSFTSTASSERSEQRWEQSEAGVTGGNASQGEQGAAWGRKQAQGDRRGLRGEGTFTPLQSSICHTCRHTYPLLLARRGSFRCFMCYTQEKTKLSTSLL